MAVGFTVWATRQFWLNLPHSDFAIFVGQEQRPDLSTPALRWLIQPIAAQELATGAILWLLAAAACCALSWWLIVRELGLSRLQAWLIGAVVCASSPILYLWYLGQMTWLLVPLVTLAWKDSRHDNPDRAVLWLTAAALLKPPFALLLLALPASRWLMGGILAFVAISLDFSAWQAWLETAGTVTWQAHEANASVFGFLTRLHAGVTLVYEVPHWIAVTYHVTAVCIVAVTAWLSRAQCRAQRLASWLCAALLIAPLGWVYYLPAALAPLVDRSRQMNRWLVAGLFVGLLPYPFFLTHLGTLHVSLLWIGTLWPARQES